MDIQIFYFELLNLGAKFIEAPNEHLTDHNSDTC